MCYGTRSDRRDGLYLILAIVVVKLAIRYARTHGKSPKRWGLSAALIMYLIPFWDWIPTVAAHKYYCEKEAGFWVYKTLDEWITENLGVMEELRQIVKPIQKTNYGYLQIIDERFHLEIHRGNPVSSLSTSVDEKFLVDSITGEVLVKEVNVSSGVGYITTGGGFKFWLNQEPCQPGGISNFIKEIQKNRGVK